MNVIRSLERPLEEPKLVMEEVTDPVEIARAREQEERAKRNTDWLQAHWSDLLPQARGKFLAVAGEEAFLGETPTEAWERAKAAHPADNGAFVRYLRTDTGPRIYAYRR